jgi:D-beta-D-heptose 7-phosphate kinase/D-beta-D-heptose 1-phosphate adenosyltransferase|tara:strand:- start:21151 stop:21558 length:408 start_codon:yes stop_codon:yes gene_type:complete
MKTVFVNGTFDILHPGHIELFRVARSLGDRVIVATDSDVKIKKDKGQTKPINDLCYRISMLESIKYIDVVHYFNDRKGLEDLIRVYKPDILLLGNDWENGDVVGKDIVKEVRFLPRVGDYSSSSIIKKILINNLD